MEQYDSAVALWQSYKITSTDDLDKYLDSFRILFAFHSGKIENGEITYHDTREIFETGRVLNYTGSPRAIVEQQNQKLCYGYLKEKIIRKEPLSAGLVKEVHKILTGGTYDEQRYIMNEERPGEYKKHDYVTGVYEVGSAAARVGTEIAEVLEEVDQPEGKDILKAAAYFHARFEFIHPFAVGNGRVGRTLLNYYLMTHGHPPLIVFDEDKRLYFECLQQYDETEDLKPLYRFFKYETQKTWEKALALAKGVKQERKDLSDLI